jgi:hypothetical protein
VTQLAAFERQILAAARSRHLSIGDAARVLSGGKRPSGQDRIRASRTLTRLWELDLLRLVNSGPMSSRRKTIYGITEMGIAAI